MNDHDFVQIPFLAHESTVSRLERIIHRLIVVVILLIVLLVGTNGAWLWCESQFETIAVEQDVDTGNGRTIINGVGDLNIGEGETEDNGQTP